jgi:hypothetical protein
MEQHEKIFWDGVAVVIGGLSVFWESIPTLAALAALVYTLIRIPETELYKKWTKPK